jgi:hypothetical protein
VDELKADNKEEGKVTSQSMMENTVEPLQGHSLPLIRPRVSTPIEIYLLQVQLGEEAPKLSHHAPIEIGVVLVRSIHNEIKITRHFPRAGVKVPDVLQLLEEKSTCPHPTADHKPR